jgi:3',5'-cyclic-AMP phosphodiesterase
VTGSATGPAPVVAQITDPHLRAAEPWRVRQLECAIHAVLGAGVPLTAVLLTGDVADAGSAAEYAPVPELLARLDAPVVVIPGNHDDRAAMRAALGLPGEPTAPIQSVLVLPGLRIVAADTTIPGVTAGDVDVDWVRARLAEDLVTPTVLALHHPPIDIASVEMDQIGLPRSTREALAAALADAPNVVGVVCGHTHRTLQGRLGGVPVVIAPSCTTQLSFDPPGAPALAWTDDPPAVMLHVPIDGQLVSHVLPIARAPNND